jgi:hypothetical protein
MSSFVAPPQAEFVLMECNAPIWLAIPWRHLGILVGGECYNAVAVVTELSCSALLAPSRNVRVARSLYPLSKLEEQSNSVLHRLADLLYHGHEFGVAPTRRLAHHVMSRSYVVCLCSSCEQRLFGPAADLVVQHAGQRMFELHEQCNGAHEKRSRNRYGEN